jgi:hypothetical protein
MPTWKLLVMIVGWVLASVAIAIVISIVLTEFLVLVGLIDWGTPEYAWTLNGMALVLFLAIAAVPIVFRKRFGETTSQSMDE